MQIASMSGVLSSLQNGTVSLIAIILSGVSGGFFAGFFSNHFESKRRIDDKRNDKYFEHRNSIVQIEQELIPLRVNIARNQSAINDAIDNTNDSNIRFILRFYKLSLSSGLGLKLLSLDFINQYAQLYSSIESFNSDIEYVLGMVTMVRENARNNRTDISLFASYKQFLPQMKAACEEIDRLSLNLLILSKLAISKEDKETREKYIEEGKEIKYTFQERTMRKKKEEIANEEDGSMHPDENRPRFVSPFLDMTLVRFA